MKETKGEEEGGRDGIHFHRVCTELIVSFSWLEASLFSQDSSSGCPEMLAGHQR